ncbi:MAG TPA: leucyl aminopeptidase [Blastocatellia bacterium]|jgi:leucyl aminopeptidase|nr:leucyl aminopeptidase [Blastocatellia bacterium]
MKITACRTNLNEIKEDVLIVPVFAGETPRDGALALLDTLSGGSVSRAYDVGDIDGKKDRWTLLYNGAETGAQRLLFYGAGKLNDARPIDVQRMAGAAIRLLGERRVVSVAFLVRDKLNGESARAIVEGAALGLMDGDLLKSKEEDTRRIEALTIVSESPTADIESAVAVGAIMAEATNFARALAYEPGNTMTPTALARSAQEMAAREGLQVETLGEEQMKELGMGALLAVSRGSAEPATLTMLTYNPDGDPPVNGDIIALVGKGITFDSGGISIKPALNMEEMKYDMGGGAAVIGAMQVIARLKPSVRVMGIVPASENLPSGRAVKPGDVVRSLSGKTIEVVNTDAEGRLILADAITYAINHGATHIVDVATLTGACAIALGEVRAGVVGSDQALIDELVKAGEECGERLWQLPLDKEYSTLIKSDIADVKNVGNRSAGAITAAAFLKHFTGSLPWAHLDIAGTAWLEHAKPYMAKGATGFGVRVMANFVLNRGTH